MKRVIILISSTIFLVTVSFGQNEIYSVTLAGLNTPTTVPVNSSVQFDMIQGVELPFINCGGIYSLVNYKVNYYLENQSTNQTYNIGSDYFFIEGYNCQSLSSQYWTNPGVQDVTIPCYIPSGNYWFKVSISNPYTTTLSPVNSEPSDIYIYGVDVNNGYTNIITVTPYNNILAWATANIMDLTITNPSPTVLTNVTFSSTNTCTTNGTVTATPVGGVPPFTYEWFEVIDVLSNVQVPIGQSTQTATGLNQGYYAVTITDSFGCSLNSLETFGTFGFVNVPYYINPMTSLVHPCTWDEGSIYINPIGGIAPYTYLWNTGSTTSGIEGVIAGNYNVTVTDANGCMASSSTVLANQFDENTLDYPNGLVITTNTPGQVSDLNGDNLIRIRGTLIIEDNVNYTLNNQTIEFARDQQFYSPDAGHTHSGVIVKTGGKLTATNCTFRGVSDCNAMWDGIQIWGDDCKPPVIGHSGKNKLSIPCNQDNGELVLNSCTVQDARIGVAAYRVNIPFIINPQEYGRGLLKASNSTFLNNRIGVAFQGKNLVENNSFIKNCNFICNAPLIASFEYNGEGTEIFIRLGRVKNPFIGANTFNGNLAFGIDQRGTGIRSYDAGYTVRSYAASGPVYNPSNPPVPNVFNDLSQGIDVYSKGGASSSILVKDNEFNNVYQGITANGSNFSEISFNTFNTPIGDPAFNSWAMFLETSSGFLATENVMNTLGTNNYTFGVVTRDVDLIMSEVYKNDFDGDYQSATQAEGTSNDEIQIDCNQYQGTNTFDWAVLSGTMADQGEDIPSPDKPQLNVFGTCTLFDDSQVYSQTSAFEYFSNANFVPTCVSAAPTPTIITSFSFPLDENSCPQLVTDPCPSCVIALENQLTGTPPGLDHKKIKGEYVRRLAQNGDVQDLIDFLVNEGGTKDRKIIIPTHLERKEFSEARAELNMLDQSTFENQKYYELFDVLIFIGEDGRELDSITNLERQIIEAVATTNTQVSIQAQSVLAELDHGWYLRFPEQVMSQSSAMIISNSDENSFEAVKDLNLKVFPNPSEGDVTISFEQPKYSKAQLLDAMGRLVHAFELDENQRFYELTSLSYGVYTLVIRYNDGEIETKRLIIE